MKNASSQHGDNRYNISPNRDITQGSLVLGCDESENAKEVKRKYRKLARKYHPDKWCGQCNFSRSEGERIFKGIANAYDMLSMRR